MAPKKILVVRQKTRADGSVALEPVAWKDDIEESEETSSPTTSVPLPSSPSVSQAPVVCNPNVTANDVTFPTDGTDTAMNPSTVDDDDDILTPATCDEPVEDDKMLYTMEPLENWFNSDFGSEVIDEMLGPGFAVVSNQEENLVPELGITEPIEDASLAALKYSPEKVVPPRKKRQVIQLPRAELQKYTSPRRPIPYPRACNLCDKICHTRNQYKSHRLYHHSPYKFAMKNAGEPRKCEFCEKEFTMKAAFMKHQRSMHWKELDLAEPKFPCRYCERVYIANSSRIYHEMTQHRPKCFPCRLCGLTFKAYENLNKHLKTHNASCLRCCKCRNLFRDAVALRRHFQNKHPEMDFDECMITINEKAKRHLARRFNATQGKPVEETMTFESAEKLDEFLKTNPNYQIVEADENGQLSYHLVDTTDTSVLEETVVTEPLAETQIQVGNELLQNLALGSGMVGQAAAQTLLQTGQSNGELVGSLSDGSLRLEIPCEGVTSTVPVGAVAVTSTIGQAQSQAGLGTVALQDLRGKLAYRCQACSMMFAETESLMKHCLIKHQEIAQVVVMQCSQAVA